jgi:RNA polymerase sigma-70 factor (ECF subfamily)
MPPDMPLGADEVSPPALVDAGSQHERELVAAILRKDRKATARFVAVYADAVYRYVRHRLAPRADLVDDIVQDVFLVALGSLPGFLGNAPLRSWLLGIARHKVEGYYRQRLREPEPLGDGSDQTEPVAGGMPIDDRIDRERVAARTHQVLGQLPEPYALALLWRYWEGRSAQEMAMQSGKSTKAIERLLARARQQFRRRWDDE